MTKYQTYADKSLTLVFGGDPLVAWQIEELLLFSGVPSLSEGDICFLHALTNDTIAGDCTVIFSIEAITIKAYGFDGTLHTYKFKPEEIKDFWYKKHGQQYNKCYTFISTRFVPHPITTIETDKETFVIPVKRKGRKYEKR